MENVKNGQNYMGKACAHALLLSIRAELKRQYMDASPPSPATSKGGIWHKFLAFESAFRGASKILANAQDLPDSIEYELWYGHLPILLEALVDVHKSDLDALSEFLSGPAPDLRFTNNFWPRQVEHQFRSRYRYSYFQGEDITENISSKLSWKSLSESLGAMEITVEYTKQFATKRYPLVFKLPPNEGLTLKEWLIFLKNEFTQLKHAIEKLDMAIRDAFSSEDLKRSVTAHIENTIFGFTSHMTKTQRDTLVANPDIAASVFKRWLSRI